VPSPKDDKLSAGAIIGIVLGSVAFLAFAGFAAHGFFGSGGSGNKEQEMVAV